MRVHDPFFSPNSVFNTWGSYGKGERPGGQIELADGIRRYLRAFVLAVRFVCEFSYFRAWRGRCRRVLYVNFRSFRLFNFFDVHFSW